MGDRGRTGVDLDHRNDGRGRGQRRPPSADTIETDALVETAARVAAIDVVDEVDETARRAGAATEGLLGVFLSAPFCSLFRDAFGNAGVSTGCACSEHAGTGVRGVRAMAERSFECGASTPWWRTSGNRGGAKARPPAGKIQRAGSRGESCLGRVLHALGYTRVGQQRQALEREGRTGLSTRRAVRGPRRRPTLRALPHATLNACTVAVNRFSFFSPSASSSSLSHRSTSASFNATNEPLRSASWAQPSSAEAAPHCASPRSSGGRMSHFNLMPSSLRAVEFRSIAGICANAAKRSRWPRYEPSVCPAGTLGKGFVAVVYRCASANGPS